ncbi:hypothetical protein TWF718_003666 [Orbilia javanica]|uniref:CFEM domain-containing protein n=1 Tax=Orbilia javanica TaxID=47235 RepID=A0AAN8NA59_9PEZI
MKFSTVILAVATFATAAFAQIDKFPSCGQTCLISNIGSAGCTGIDIPCICNSKPFFDKVVPCIDSSCSAADQEKSIAAAVGLCKDANPNVGDWLPKPPTTTAPPATTTPPAPTNTGKPSPCKPKLRFARNL